MQMNGDSLPVGDFVSAATAILRLTPGRRNGGVGVVLVLLLVPMFRLGMGLRPYDVPRRSPMKRRRQLVIATRELVMS